MMARHSEAQVAGGLWQRKSHAHEHLCVFLVLRPMPQGGGSLEPGLEAKAAVCNQRMLAEVEPVLDGAPVPPSLTRPVQAHVLAPAGHLRNYGHHLECSALIWQQLHNAQ